jgi:hypothetical protein
MTGNPFDGGILYLKVVRFWRLVNLAFDVACLQNSLLWAVLWGKVLSQAA